jgi:hypothetical protein
MIGENFVAAAHQSRLISLPPRSRLGRYGALDATRRGHPARLIHSALSLPGDYTARGDVALFVRELGLVATCRCLLELYRYLQCLHDAIFVLFRSRPALRIIYIKY